MSKDVTTAVTEDDNDPLACSLDDFLCGCDGPSPWCNQHFDDYIGDIDQQPDGDIVVLEGSAIAGVLPGNGSYALTTSSDCPLLLHRKGDSDPWSVVGYYATPGAVCISDAHQGQGLGAELILYTALEWTGGPPTEALDEQLFSEAGYAAHAAAWRLGVERGLVFDPKMTPAPRALKKPSRL